MSVMFHQMGHRVQKFFANISFGFLSYRMDRTHSILRVATTASPISGSDVKEQMRRLHLLRRIHHSVHVISVAYLNYKSKSKTGRLKDPEEQECDTSSTSAQELPENERLRIKKVEFR